ncbi:NUDIX hydrolase [Microbacterium sp. ASV49]|uniref:NUDIX hydrolase n=1 Tax=Microbacterium candidum TaxID=3041922 RepID=A0ABT7N128_9MICO|nr:NUDIX hydrolase [Microbacterium sp. ASV49]MDL9980408.1 NUDIX hydrolase [Microbacterium sp. ASV49]
MSETPAQRSFRAILDASRDARPRLPEDAEDPDIPVAGTAVVVRDGQSGVEVLMIERPARGSFAGAWVFPGGKVEASDRPSPDDPEEDVARNAAVRETHEEAGFEVEALRTLSVWDPPPGIPLRIRTWFFVARAQTAEWMLSADEVVSAEWVRPDDMLERHARGEVVLYPPTWVTLHSLAGFAAVPALVEAVRFERFDSVARTGESGPMMMWQDDGEYVDAAAPASTARHRLEIGALPWIYTRTAG